MAKYIDIDDERNCYIGNDGEYERYNIDPDVLDEAVEIIHCKDCEHWNRTWTNDFAPNYHYCPMVDGTRRDDFYCADAEEREDV